MIDAIQNIQPDKKHIKDKPHKDKRTKNNFKQYFDREMKKYECKGN